MLPRLLSCGLLQVDGASTICTVDHIHGSISATLCNLLQVGPGADEAQTGAVAEEKAALAMIFFFYTLKLIARTENLTVTRSFTVQYSNFTTGTASAGFTVVG